jgi:restriction system protein
LEALRNLGGSGSLEEIVPEVAKVMSLEDTQLEILHNPENGGQTEFEYRLAWTRTYLKKFGLLENSARGVWALTPMGSSTPNINQKEVVAFVKSLDRAKADEETFEITGDEITA